MGDPRDERRDDVHQEVRVVPAYLTEADVARVLTPAVAANAVEGSFARLARGEVDNPPRVRLPIPDGQFAVMPCVDRGLGLRRPEDVRVDAGRHAVPRRPDDDPRARDRCGARSRHARTAAHRGRVRGRREASRARRRIVARRDRLRPAGRLACGRAAGAAAVARSASSSTAATPARATRSAASTTANRRRRQRTPAAATSSSPRPRRSRPSCRATG